MSQRLINTSDSHRDTPTGVQCETIHMQYSIRRPLWLDWFKTSPDFDHFVLTEINWTQRARRKCFKSILWRHFHTLRRYNENAHFKVWQGSVLWLRFLNNLLNIWQGSGLGPNFFFISIFPFIACYTNESSENLNWS